jgi:AcrR family transcriptional regulator
MIKKDTKTAIMDAAEALFLKHGFRRVTVDEICRSAKVSRKTFYVYFANKEALTTQLLDQIVDTLTGEFIEIMNGNASFSYKMTQMMEMKLELSRRLSMDFFTDLFTASSDEVFHHYRRKADENIAIARSLFIQAQEKGEIRSELDIDFIMTMLNNQTDLCEKPEFRARFKDSESMVKQMSELFLFGIVGNKEGSN